MERWGCDELVSRISDCSAGTGRLVAQDKSETMVVPTDLSTTTKQLLPYEQARRDLLREYLRKFANQIMLRCRFHEDCRPRTVEHKGSGL